MLKMDFQYSCCYGVVITVVEFWVKQATEGSCLMQLMGLGKKVFSQVLET